MDVFMVLRETAFIILSIPTLFYGVRTIRGLMRVDVASGRIFLRIKGFMTILRLILCLSLFGLGVGVFLYFWSITGMDVFRIAGGCSAIATLASLLAILYRFSKLLGVEG